MPRLCNEADRELGLDASAKNSIILQYRQNGYPEAASKLPPDPQFSLSYTLSVRLEADSIPFNTDIAPYTIVEAILATLLSGALFGWARTVNGPEPVTYHKYRCLLLYALFGVFALQAGLCMLWIFIEDAMFSVGFWL